VIEGGVHIEVELWQMPVTSFGRFVDLIPPPLTIGSVILDSGETAKEFVCESAALTSARDISSCGGWIAFLAASQREWEDHLRFAGGGGYSLIVKRYASDPDFSAVD
jgi:allophanate hydrolase-like protein